MTVAAIIALWPNAEVFAADLGAHYSAGRVMKHKGRIPEKHWDAILRAAKVRGLPLTREMLKAAHPEPAANEPAAPEAA